MYKKRGDMKAYTGPVWDFDLAFDNDKRLYPISEYQKYLLSSAPNTYPFTRHILYADQWTREQRLEYWHRARNAGINADELCLFVDSVLFAFGKRPDLPNAVSNGLKESKAESSPTEILLNKI